MGAMPSAVRRRPGWQRLSAVAGLIVVAGCALGVWPYSAYLWCGWSRPTALPERVQVGFYEEFPTAARLAKLEQIDYPIALAVAAASRAEFEALAADLQQYPQIQTLYFWPVLTPEEGYYAGPWSAGAGVQRAATEAAGRPVLWDLEFPRGGQGWAPGDWLGNRRFIEAWWAAQTAPVAVWRSFAGLGLASPVLGLAGMEVDPTAYPAVRLHLDLYTSGAGRPAWLTARILRCGVERYGDRFVPALGVLDDGLGPGRFVSPAVLARDAALARAAGVSELWVFGLNGLNADYAAALRAGLGD